MIRYLIFRHGHARHDVPEREKSLTGLGREQADRLGKRLSSFNVSGFISSPLLRSRQTAEIVNGYLEIDLELDRRLEEVGTYRMYYEIANGVEEEQRNRLGDFNRAQLGLVELLNEIQEDEQERTVLLSTHGNIIQALLAITIGVTDTDALNRLIVANTGLTVLEWLGEEDYQLIVFNDTNHLGELKFR